jgi:WD40 repeat protein
LRNIFAMVDANGDKTITWSEFSDFLLLENESLNVNQESARHHVLAEPCRPPLVSIANGHKACINKVLLADQRLDNLSYLTSSFDGTVKVWNSKTLSHITTLCNRCFELDPCHCRRRVPIHDISIMHPLATSNTTGTFIVPSLLAVAGSDPSLNFYDLNKLQIASR